MKIVLPRTYLTFPVTPFTTCLSLHLRRKWYGDLKRRIYYSNILISNMFETVLKLNFNFMWTLRKHLTTYWKKSVNKWIPVFRNNNGHVLVYWHRRVKAISHIAKNFVFCKQYIDDVLINSFNCCICRCQKNGTKISKNIYFYFFFFDKVITKWYQGISV